jgi:hypothetical protein
MVLTITKIRSAEVRGRDYKIADERGLYLYVTAKGAKSWRFKYRFMGKEKRLTFGLFPEVSLAEARLRRDHARLVLRSGRDPQQEAGLPIGSAAMEDARQSS